MERTTAGGGKITNNQLLQNFSSEIFTLQKFLKEVIKVLVCLQTCEYSAVEVCLQQLLLHKLRTAANDNKAC